MEARDSEEDQINRAELVQALFAYGVTNPYVLNAIQAVPRHFFVPVFFQAVAYMNIALPIGEGQTISQPYVVARMTELVFSKVHHEKILEIGTGSGYQAAVLAQLYQEVYTVERIQGLIERANARFQKLNIKNIHSFYSDGFQGYPEGSPYDAILVTAAADEIPHVLLNQLKVGGRLVIPIKKLGYQILTLAEKLESGIKISHHGAVRFVPMLGGLD